MIVLWVILIILLVILLLPLGTDFELDGGARLRVRLGPVWVKILPRSEKRRRKTRARKESEEKPALEKTGRRKIPSMSELFSLLDIGVKALKRFRRRLYVDLLELRLTAGGPDPCVAAILYGGLSAAAGMLMCTLPGALYIEELDVSADVDFSANAVKIRCRLILTIQIWQIIYIAFALFAGYLRLRRKTKRDERKKLNGTEQNERADERDNEQDQRDGGRKHHRRKSYHNA